MVKVVLGGMSAVLAESLGDMVKVEPDIEVVHSTTEVESALAAVRRYRADVLIVQSDRAPGSLAGLLDGKPLGIVLIDRDGHGGSAARISVAARRLGEISRDALIEAVRTVSRREGT